VNVDLTGRVAIVTGAGQGLGLALAKALSASGAQVLLTDVRPETLDDAVGQITSVGGIDGTIGQVNYCAAKAGIIGLTKGAARELTRYKVTVKAIAPIAASPMTELVRTRADLVEKLLPTSGPGCLSQHSTSRPAPMCALGGPPERRSWNSAGDRPQPRSHRAVHAHRRRRRTPPAGDRHDAPHPTHPGVAGRH
jgi:NAD(P)-dependent dehydrogenase (short-subunit alcohol dehydrogenase family)